MIKFIIIFCVFLLLILSIMAIAVIIVNKKAKSTEEISSVGDTESTESNLGTVGDSKDFFPVEDFCDYAMDLGNQEYRAILEVGSINYGLLSPEEQAITDLSYQGMLNSLSFPIEIYVQTTEFDNVEMQKLLHENIQGAVDMFPSIADYAVEYEENMKYLTDYLGNSKIKKKYVIIPYGSTDVSDVSSLSESEVKDFALEELNTRVSVVANGLAGCNLPVKLLNKKEIAEVLYAFYHRDYSRIAQDILGGEYSDIVLSGNPYNDKFMLDSILADAENRIRTSLSGSGSPEEETLYKYIIEILGDLRKDTSPKNLKQLLDLSREKAAEERYKTYGTRFVGEPTEEDYLEAFNILGSGVSKEDIKDYVEEHFSAEESNEASEDESVETEEALPDDFWIKTLGLEDDEEVI